MKGIKKLSDKYFVKEHDGVHINTEEVKKTAGAVAFETIFFTGLAVGGLAAIGLAKIGLETVRDGAVIVGSCARSIINHLK